VKTKLCSLQSDPAVTRSSCDQHLVDRRTRREVKGVEQLDGGEPCGVQSPPRRPLLAVEQSELELGRLLKPSHATTSGASSTSPHPPGEDLHPACQSQRQWVHDFDALSYRVDNPA
jgi:hypothetical protein